MIAYRVMLLHNVFINDFETQRYIYGTPLPCFMPFGNCMLSYSFTISELLYTYVKMYKRFLNGRNPIALDFMFSFFRWLYLCFWRCFKFYGDRFVIHLSFLGVSSIFKIALYIFFYKGYAHLRKLR